MLIILHTQNVFNKILNFLNIKEHPAKRHIDRKLIFRIRIFYAIGIIMTGLMLYDVLEGMIGRIVGMRLKIKNILSEQFIMTVIPLP